MNEQPGRWTYYQYQQVTRSAADATTSFLARLSALLLMLLPSVVLLPQIQRFQHWRRCVWLAGQKRKPLMGQTPAASYYERNYIMATTKKSAAVEIKPMELQTVEFSIVGTSPLIIHAWDDKAKQMMLDKQRGKATKTKHEIKIPVNDFMGALYWLTDKPQPGESDEEAEAIWLDVKDTAKFGFPVTGIKQSAIMGAKRGGLDVVATELRGSFFIEGATEASTIDIAEIIGAEPWMREDMVKVGGMSKTADIRFRPQFDEWEIPLKMTYNINGKYSLEQLLNCFNVGGFVCGIGEWRPERDGQMGMYRVKI